MNTNDNYWLSFERATAIRPEQGSVVSGFDERLREVRESFIARCGERADKLEDALSEGRRGEIAGIAHDIAGTGGIFGFNDLSVEARALDQLAKSEGPYEYAVRSMVLRLRDIASGAA